MPSGNTITDALNDSLPLAVSSARVVRDYEQVVPQLVDRQTLGEGLGLSWREITLDQLTAQGITENQLLDNPQQITDSLFTITPTVVGLNVVITDRVAARISKSAFAKTGGLAQSAIERKKDEDGIIVFDGASTSLGGAGTTATTSLIAAASERILGNSTEPGKMPLRAVLHPAQIKDFYDEITAPIGTASLDGESARVFREGFKGMIDSVSIFSDGNITVDASDDAKGGVFAGDAIVLVQGRAPRAVTVRNEKLGGGATEMLLYDEYAYGERSAGNWLYEIYTDATPSTG
jgi:hypothetical protein